MLLRDWSCAIIFELNRSANAEPMRYDETVTRVRIMFGRIVGSLALALALMAPMSGGALQPLATTAPGVLPADYQPWPKEFNSGGVSYRIYEPQAERWNGTDVKFRAAVAVTADGGTRYGIVWGTARTWSDSATGLVKLESIRLERANFPTGRDGGESYLRDLQRSISGTWLVRREQLDPNQAVEQRIPVRNDPPRIFVSYSPALLVLIDGAPALRKVPDSRYERVINTRSLLLKDPNGGRYYLQVFDGWLTARDLSGPWQIASSDSNLEQVKEQIAAAGQVDLLDGGEDRPSLTSGAPVIYVSSSPAELIVLKGEPQFEPIGGTNLLWAKNTTAPLLLDTGSNDYFAVISGRWFRARSLNGPWSYAPADKLPGDLALIPDDHPLAPVRTAVPGTPQAQEAVIANSVPQTATIRRSEARFQPTIDGAPQLRPIEGTQLQHVANSPTPIIRIDENSWYAVDQGVWFVAQSLDGPWEVATWVPSVIYSIPANSPLHYVTYVKVYGATPDAVYTGYTPGYLGAVTGTSGTVVYGTGVAMSPWVGSVWFGAPWTYGFGWSVGVGPFWPTWSPWIAPWWGPAWGGWWRPPFWGWGWGWGPRPGWGWVRPPVFFHPPFRPPVFFPAPFRPPIARHPGFFRPGAVPPGVRPAGVPQVPRAPATAFLDSSRYRFGPSSNLLANQSVPKGPGWNAVAPNLTQSVSALPQGFQRLALANPNRFAAATAAGATAAPGAAAAGALTAPRTAPVAPNGWQTFRGVPQPNANAFSGSTYRGAPSGLGVGATATPGAATAAGAAAGALTAPRTAPVAPNGWQTFRGVPQPNANAFSGSTYRGAPSGLGAISGGGIATPRAAVPTYAPPVGAPAQPQAYIRGNPIPNGNQFGRVPPVGGAAQPNFPRYNPGAGAGALPRFNGGMAAPSAPAMMPRGGGAMPGGMGGGAIPGGMGAPVGGFRGPAMVAPAAPRGPGWGGGRR